MGILICPICKSRLEPNGQSFCCKHGHSFDLSASGYLHLLPANQMRSKIPGDNKQMVRARKEFLSKGYYQPVSDLLNHQVLEHCKKGTALQILDAGCGEGYYTNRLTAEFSRSGAEFAVTGLDISKFAVDAAAKAAKSDRDIAQLIEIHTKKFDFILVGICLSLQRRTKLCGNIREIRKVGCLIPSKVIAIIYSNLFRRFSTLCIDQNNTKGSTRTINRGRSGVFQYRDTFNILRIQERDIVHRNSIHHNQWITLFRVA